MSLRKIKPKSHKELMDKPSGSGGDKQFPRFRMELVHLPEAREWKIGKEYQVLLKVKMTGLSISKFQNDSEFDIIGIDPNVKKGNSEQE